MAKKDKLLMGPESNEEGQFPYIRHRPDGTVTTGLVGPPCPEGRPLGDSLCLKHEEGPHFEVIHEHQSSSKGPAKITTEAYRQGWDSLFGEMPIGEA